MAKKGRFVVEDRETGNGTFGIFDTIEEARDFIKKSEEDDEKNGQLSRGYYAIHDMETDEYENFGTKE